MEVGTKLVISLKRDLEAHFLKCEWYSIPITH